jgi:hypothetical protein
MVSDDPESFADLDGHCHHAGRSASESPPVGTLPRG